MMKSVSALSLSPRHLSYSLIVEGKARRYWSEKSLEHCGM